MSIDEVCVDAAERAVFVRTADGDYRRFQPLRHCGDGRLTTVYVREADGEFAPVPLAQAPAQAFFRLQGFQLVPAELSELWAEIRGLDWRIFLPWFLAAIADQAGRHLRQRLALADPARGARAST